MNASSVQLLVEEDLPSSVSHPDPKITRRLAASLLTLLFVFTVSMLAPTTGAKAACPVPNQISNGQPADATVLMGDLNALGSCATAATGSPAAGNLAVFSGASSIAAGNLSGDCITSGTSNVTCTKSNGVPLGYFATGTDAGQLTGTVSVSRFNGGIDADSSHYLRGDGVWAPAPAGGGSGTAFSPYVPNGMTLLPVAKANWVQTNSTGVSATMTDLAGGRGVNFQITADTSSIQESKIDLSGYTPPAAGTNFTVLALVLINSRTAQNWVAGLQVTDTSGKIEVFGLRNGGNLFAPADFRYMSMNSLSTAGSLGLTWYNSLLWMKLQRVGSNFVFSMSTDGETFDTFYNQSATAFLGANLSTVGLIIGPNTGRFSMSVFHFSAS